VELGVDWLFGEVMEHQIISIALEQYASILRCDPNSLGPIPLFTLSFEVHFVKTSFVVLYVVFQIWWLSFYQLPTCALHIYKITLALHACSIN
jgi:hypothetical protein